MNSLSDRLREAFDDADIKPNDVVSALGLTRSAITYWLDGSTKHIRPEYLFPLARLLNVNPEWLGTGKGDRKSNENHSTQEQKPTYSVKTLNKVKMSFDIPMSPTLKNKLALEAKKNGRNFYDEMIFRLEQSLKEYPDQIETGTSIPLHLSDTEQQMLDLFRQWPMEIQLSFLVLFKHTTSRITR